MAKNPYKTMFRGVSFKKNKFHRPEGAGNFDNMDDYNIVKSLNMQQGTTQTISGAKDIVNKEYVDNVSVNTGIDLFGYKENSDIEGYYTMKPDIDGTAKETVSDSVPGNTNNYLIGSFITESSYNAYALIRILTRGVYEMHAHLKAGSAGRLKFYGEFYVRDNGGSETLIGTTELTDFIGNTEEEHNFHLTVSEEYPLSSGDRIVVKVYANNSHPVATNIDIYMEGTTGTRVEVRGVSFQRQHDSLANLDYASAGHTGFQQELTEGTGITIAGANISTNDSEINHNSLSNTHNLTTDIDHTAIQNIGTNTHQEIDNHLANNNQAHSDYLKNDASDTTTGDLTTNGGKFILKNEAGTFRVISWTTDDSLRWEMGANNSAESGSDAGSNFGLFAKNDNGTHIDTPILISRKSGGDIDFRRPLDMNNYRIKNIGNAGTDFTSTGGLTLAGDFTANGNVSLCNSSTETITCTGRFKPRQVSDAGMNNTDGTEGEIVYNIVDNKFYGCTSGGSPATWAAFH
ncbi:MAG: hypothetical protein ACTSR1_01030 [Candidatus Heimdallarchaeota archaeon]